MFGIEDGLVSTTGAIAGVAAGSRNAQTVLMAGTVVLTVEALSMAAGQLLSERAVHQLDPTHDDSPVVGAVTMFVAYVIGGLVPLLPIAALRSLTAVVIGTALAFPALFLLGWTKGRIVETSAARSGLEVLAVGGTAAVAGVMVGLLLEAS
jgi:VIT1/CCC1 family predicted Fe2+/Mn2+ transporter